MDEILEYLKKVETNSLLAAKKVLNIDDVAALIDILPDSPMKMVMRRRYINFQRWEQIAEAMSYSWANVHKLHAQALNYILREVNHGK